MGAGMGQTDSMSSLLDSHLNWCLIVYPRYDVQLVLSTDTPRWCMGRMHGMIMNGDREGCVWVCERISSLALVDLPVNAYTGLIY